MVPLFEFIVKPSRLLQRLYVHLDRNVGFSPNQCGFRKSRSTKDAINMILEVANQRDKYASQRKKLCVFVALDVNNDFNATPCEHIDAALRPRIVPIYLKHILRS